jgi:hypothetical protein
MSDLRRRRSPASVRCCSNRPSARCDLRLPKGPMEFNYRPRRRATKIGATGLDGSRHYRFRCLYRSRRCRLPEAGELSVRLQPASAPQPAGPPPPP